MSDRRLPAGGESASAASIVLRRLTLHSALPEDAVAALQRLLGRATEFARDSLIAEAGDDADLVTIIRDGFACRMSLLPDGRRQIHSVLLPGDTADGETALLGVRPDNIEALTACSVWLVPKTRLAALIHVQPALAEAFAREAAIAAQVAREWVVNVGQRTATERIAHFICELHARMAAIHLVRDGAFTLPLTQVEMGDAQGLSSVHVNRVLQELRAKGLIHTERGRLAVLDLDGLRATGLFDPGYLHLGHTAGPIRSPM